MSHTCSNRLLYVLVLLGGKWSTLRSIVVVTTNTSLVVQMSYFLHAELRARNASPLDKWARYSKAVNFLYYILLMFYREAGGSPV